MNVTDKPQKHVKMPNEPLEIDEEDFYIRAFIKWAIEEQPELKRLETENTQLRELVRDMWFWCYEGHMDTKSQEWQMKHINWVLDRMRDLGIEVD